MTGPGSVEPTDHSSAHRTHPSYWTDVGRQLFRNRSAILGLAVLGLLIAVALAAPVLYRGDYRAARFLPGLENGPKGLGSRYGIFGTDSLGRNVWHRAARGIGISLRLAIIVSFATTLLGAAIGGLAGYFGGMVDAIVSRVIDMLSTIPSLLVGISAITFFGPSFWTVFATLVATGWLSTARLSRISVRSIRERDYVDAARASGAGSGRILLRHILPNSLPAIIVAAAFSVSAAVLHESVYSFLGIGFIEPTPALGVMIRDARNGFQTSPHLLVVPGAILITLTIAVVLISDGLRDALDPASQVHDR